MYLISSSVALLSSTLLISTSYLQPVEATQEEYVYVVFDERSFCQMSTAAMIGHASGDEEYVLGGDDNFTAFCSVEASCLMNNQSTVCKAETIPSVHAEIRFDVDADGRIFHCDDTNENVDEPLCRFMEGCRASSVFPHCDVNLATTTDIVKNPNLIRNENAFENVGLNFHTYMLLYSDESCGNIEGAHALVAGETTLHATSDTMSCQKAIACAFNPAGALCNDHGGTTGETVTIRTKPASTKSIVCGDETDESCQEVDPQAWMKSEAFPSCWYRLATGKTLFSAPEVYFIRTNSTLDVAKEEGVTDASNIMKFHHHLALLLMLGLCLASL